ncbi:hypothetical protein [Azospira sp.]|uniref:hypothetical protein n=1 Tax=Azospira sp. TaxID=1872671 RepID=UPI00256DF500|nr:hypothetical protein [Azospira sp.]MDK9690538.1 hypothetical protein [Azospira sp.]
MAMRVENTFPLEGVRDIKVRELTVKEIRAWLADGMMKDLEKLSAVDLVLLGDVSLPDLKIMTDITDEEIEEATPSQLESLRDFCKEVNKGFFVLRKTLEEAGAKALAKSAA